MAVSVTRRQLAVGAAPAPTRARSHDCRYVVCTCVHVCQAVTMGMSEKVLMLKCVTHLHPYTPRMPPLGGHAARLRQARTYLALLAFVRRLDIRHAHARARAEVGRHALNSRVWLSQGHTPRSGAPHDAPAAA